MRYFEYETEIGSILHVSWLEEGGKLCELLVETDQGTEASEGRYKEITDYIYNTYLWE